jgi:hypothetical protein
MHVAGICLEVYGKIAKKFSECTRAPDIDLNPGSPKFDSGELHLYCGFSYYCYSSMEVSSFVCLIWIPAIVKSSIAAWNLRCNVYPEHRNVGIRQLCENACLWYRPM